MTDPRVERTRTAVHAAVLDLLVSEGPAAVTHQRVADESGVSRATIYRHWPDRAGLLVDCVAAQRPVTSPPEPSGDLREDLVDLFTMLAEEMGDHPEMPWFIAMLAQSEHDPDMVVLRQRLSAIEDMPIAPYLERLRERGVEVDEQVVAAMIVGPLFALRFIFGRQLDRDTVAQLVDAWLRGLEVDASRRGAVVRAPDGGRRFGVDQPGSR